MAIGKMTETVIFLTNTPVVKGAGWEDSYSTLLTTRGQLIDGSGGRSLSYGEVADSASKRLLVRFQNNLESAMRSDIKILINSITYTMTSFRLVDQKKHLYEFQIQCQTQ